MTDSSLCARSAPEVRVGGDENAVLLRRAVEDLQVGCGLQAVGDPVHDRRDRNAKSANAGHAVHLGGIDRDA